ncbi:hypothetical protein FNV43_RR24181 [Rhamnella rubrinervis]|uniref:BHLH domain-containing protein n=1 Tax=Rhamnella rubrinervis TaxID=2594499 RepID=A0A8K0DRS2_9ROSA|nr:hypothetical protein FNV43_RR24181 [Rhamnella rubrinervis]
MFPLHQSNELVFQISPNPHKKHKISEDLILGHASLDVDVFDNIKKRKPAITTNLKTNDYLNSNTNKKKKTATDQKTMNHRDSERLRRQEMATLYASLRSLLPHELIKEMGFQGKRSTSEHITQATNYIKHLQNKIREIDIKRDELEKLSNSSNSDHHDHGISSGSSSSRCLSSHLIIKVHPFSSGLEIVISREGTFPLSRVLELLIEEGLSINTCFSTTINDRFQHTIHSDQVSNLRTINLSSLEQKLTKVISSW